MAQVATLRRPKTAAKKAGPNPPRPWARGQFYWNELRTRDSERAMQFYAGTVSWSFEASATPDGHAYWVALSDGKPVAGLFPLVSPSFAKVTEGLMSFLAVDDVDAHVAKAVKAGAKLAMPMFDVPDIGRIAMLMEPSGAGVGWITPLGASPAKA